jgi:hypothetical protein
MEKNKLNKLLNQSFEQLNEDAPIPNTQHLTISLDAALYPHNAIGWCTSASDISKI